MHAMRYDQRIPKICLAQDAMHSNVEPLPQICPLSQMCGTNGKVCLRSKPVPFCRKYKMASFVAEGYQFVLHQNDDAAPGDTVRTEDIIDAVRSYPILYHTSRQDYRDMVKKENAWKAVAEATGCASKYIMPCRPSCRPNS